MVKYKSYMRGWRNWQTRMIQVTYPKCKGLKSAKANDKIVIKITLKKLICGYGETGKHVWFRSICRETCRFKSCYPHHRSKPYVSRLWAFFGPFRGGNKPPVLPGEEKGFSKAKNGAHKAAEVVANN